MMDVRMAAALVTGVSRGVGRAIARTAGAGGPHAFRVPRYVGFVTEWPMSGTKIKKVILREMIAADLKGKGHYPRPQDHDRALEGYIH